MNTSVYFLDLSTPSFSVENAFDGDHSACITFDAGVSYPEDELTVSGESIASARWRIALYDQSSIPEIKKPAQSIGTLTWRPSKDESKPATCLVMIELKATTFSRLLALLQTGNTVGAAELTIIFPTLPWATETESSVGVASVSLEAGFSSLSGRDA